MAINELESILKNNGKEKNVRFADGEGHNLCEIFLINCSPHCNRARTRGRFKPAAKTQEKPLHLNFYELPWNRELLLDRVEELNVSLENVVKTQKGIIGMVAVKNISFCKEVFIRFSFDKWETWRETQAAFYKQEETREIDYFVFVVSEKAACSNSQWKLDFAICYKVAGKEYWDNNNQQNYEVLSCCNNNITC